jgi:hypothetical protein
MLRSKMVRDVNTGVMGSAPFRAPMGAPGRIAPWQRNLRHCSFVGGVAEDDAGGPVGVVAFEVDGDYEAV